MLKFRFVDRGFKKTTVLLPGWATDCRIFDGLDLDYNYFLPAKFSLQSFPEDLSGQLDRLRLRKISLFGWSLGGFLAAEFAAAHPARVEELFLLGICGRYGQETIAGAKDRLRQNRRAFLAKFYLSCFSKVDRAGLREFRRRLWRDYLREMRLEDLLQGLDYLAGAAVDTTLLRRIKKILIFHGGEDKIAPFREACRLKARLPAAKLILLPALGHLFFLNPQFKSLLDGQGYYRP